MKFPWDVAKPLRVEVALNPATEAPIWRDVSALVKGDGVRITRGGGGRHELSPAGRCSFTLDNRDGAFSDVSGTAPALYRKRVRVCYRPPGVSGNLLAAEAASFEGGTVGGWNASGSTPPVLSNSPLHPQSGTKGLLITWGAGGASPAAGISVDTVIGRIYTASAYVWIPAAHPAVQLYAVGIQFGATSTTFGAFQRISVTWTATAASTALRVWPNSSPTAGQQCFVDAVQVDEGSSVVPFTTSAPAITCRFTGRIATNDLSFPALGLALTSLTATDELAWQGSTFSTLRSVPVQEILSDSPIGLWTLADGDLGDASGVGGDVLALAGSGAVPTDGAAIAASTSATGWTFAAGQYLGAKMGAPAGALGSTGIVLEAAVRTTAAVEGTVCAVGDAFGPGIMLSVNPDGKPRARKWNPFLSTFFAQDAVSTVAVNDGQPHHLAARWTKATGTLEVLVDGTVRGTSSIAAADFIATDRVTVGGSASIVPTMTGLVAFVAVTDSPLSTARIADHAAALLNAFNGETVASRVARYNRWAGTAFGTVTALSTVATLGHFETEGKSIADAMAAVSTVEDGMTYVAGDGQLVIRGRALFINATATAVLAGPGAGQANCVREGLTFSSNPRMIVNDVTGTAPGGVTDRVVHSASIAEYGRSAESVEGPFVSLAALSSVIEWRVNTEAIPRPQADGLSVRMSQLDDATTTTLLAVDLGHVIGWTDMPSQAPASTSSGVVLGIEEMYSVGDLLWTATVAPNYGTNVMVTGDATRGVADSVNLAAY